MTLMKGAFVVFQTRIPVPTDIIVFQFNTESLQRRFVPPTDNQTAGEKGGGRQTAQSGPPTESLTVSIDLDAADLLEKADAVTTAVGLHPAIAKLELLMYPASSVLLLNKGLAMAGIAMQVSVITPTVLFVWGTTRLLPVRVTSVTVTEQQFDHRLNPINAKVEVGLTVLKSEEMDEPFTTLATVTQVAKEGLSRIGTVQSAADITALLPF
jgi:hypothetical protein